MTDVLPSNSQPELVVRPEDGAASTCVELQLEGRSTSRLWLTHFTVCIGAARVRMDGVGGPPLRDVQRLREGVSPISAVNSIQISLDVRDSVRVGYGMQTRNEAANQA